MAHYAFLDENNIVVLVIPGRDENDLIDGIDDWETFYSNEMGMRCLRTSYSSLGGKKINVQTGEIINDNHFRYNFAGIGYFYDEKLDAFIPPQPNGYFNWELDKTTCTWKPIE